MGAKCTINNLTTEDKVVRIWNPTSDLLVDAPLRVLLLPPHRKQEMEIKSDSVILQIKHVNEIGKLCHYLYHVEKAENLEIIQIANASEALCSYKTKSENKQIITECSFAPFQCYLQQYDAKLILYTIQQLKVTLSKAAEQVKKHAENNDKYKDDITILKELTQSIFPKNKYEILKLFLPVAFGGSGLGVIALDEYITASDELGFMTKIDSKELGVMTKDLSSTGTEADSVNYDDICWGCCYHLSQGNRMPKSLENLLHTVRGFDEPPTPPRTTSENQLALSSTSTSLTTVNHRYGTNCTSSVDKLGLISQALQCTANSGIFSSLKKVYEIVPSDLYQQVISGKAEFIKNSAGIITQVRSTTDHGITLGNVSLKEVGFSILTPIISVASFALGQYHLYNINDTLSHFRKTLEEVINHLEAGLQAKLNSLEKTAHEIPVVLFEAIMTNDKNTKLEKISQITHGIDKSYKLKEKIRIIALENCKNCGWKENCTLAAGPTIQGTPEQLEKTVTHLVWWMSSLKCNIHFTMLKLFERSFHEGNKEQKKQLIDNITSVTKELQRAQNILRMFYTAKFVESWSEATVNHFRNLLTKFQLVKPQQQSNREQQFHDTIQSLCNHWEGYTLISPEEAQKLLPLLLSKQPVLNYV